MIKNQILTDPVYFPFQDTKGKEFVQVVKIDPDETLLELVFSLIVSAKQRVYIETPYFVPDPSILLAIKTAVKCGVDVRIIIPGITDKELVYNASLSYVQELLQVGVRFYCYQKGFSMPKCLYPMTWLVPAVQIWICEASVANLRSMLSFMTTRL